MRYEILAVLTLSLSASGAGAAALLEPPAVSPNLISSAAVRLITPEDLARLQASNPDHYARAVRLMAAANVLCKPGEPKLQNADGRDISCAMLLLTSNPPKRTLSFTLDSTRYVAIVTITADRPKLLLLDQRKSAR